MNQRKKNLFNGRNFGNLGLISKFFLQISNEDNDIKKIDMKCISFYTIVSTLVMSVS